MFGLRLSRRAQTGPCLMAARAEREEHVSGAGVLAAYLYGLPVGGPMRLSVVIPTYNEAQNIAALLPRLRAELGPPSSIELLVVDDDSKDGTAAAARKADSKSRVIVRKGERGLATAVARGFAEAQGEWVAVMDADFQHPPEAVAAMWQRAQQGDVDLVIGSRYAPGGKGDATFTASRRAVSRGAALIARMALPPVRRHRLTDPMSGLFMVRKAAVAGVRLRPTGYKILLEIVGRVPLRGVAEVGYEFQSRRAGDSKLGSRVILQYLAHVGRLGAGHKGNWWLWVVLALAAGLAAWLALRA